jgi:hypothetical protein
MKKVISFIASFFVGFAFFVAGGAVALESDLSAPGTSQSTETAETLGESSTEAQLTQETTDAVSVSGGDVYCFQIGKATELDGDCFCVQGDVSSIEEVDCLIASGIVPAESYDDYRRHLGLTD